MEAVEAEQLLYGFLHRQKFLLFQFQQLVLDTTIKSRTIPKCLTISFSIMTVFNDY